ncbi:MAG: hypothetical protein QM667_12095 [Asticcacaulis sp.]
MTQADTPDHAAFQARLIRLADRTLCDLEAQPRGTTTLELTRFARAIIAAERMLRAIYTPLVKTKPRGADHPIRRRDGVPPAPAPSARFAATSPVSLCSQGRMESQPSSPAVAGPEVLTSSPAVAGEVASSIAKMTEGAKPATPDRGWQKGWTDKQTKMREQRAARIGKWPDGTPYRPPD